MATPTTLPATFVAGNVLTAAQMNDLRGAFRILQVVSTTKTDTFSASITAGNDTAITGLSATITPSSATSKILAVVNVAGCRDVDAAVFGIRLFRGATEIGSGAAASNRTNLLVGTYSGAGNTEMIQNVAANYLDSPATTSATTYAVHAVNIHASTTLTVFVNRSDDDTDDKAHMRPSSTITLMEVSA